MTRTRKIGLFALALIPALLMLNPVSATPLVYGYCKGPASVPYNNVFSVYVDIQNYGNTAAYYTFVRLVVPPGWEVDWRDQNKYIGTLYSGSTKSLRFRVKAPSYTSSGPIYALASFGDNPWGGTAHSVRLGGFNIRTSRGFRVTIHLSSNQPILEGTVLLYRNGKLCAAGRAYGSLWGSGVTVTVNVQYAGSYYCAAIAYLANGQNSLGRRIFSVWGDTTVSIYCIPL